MQDPSPFVCSHRHIQAFFSYMKDLILPVPKFSRFSLKFDDSSKLFTLVIEISLTAMMKKLTTSVALIYSLIVLSQSTEQSASPSFCG